MTAPRMLTAALTIGLFFAPTLEAKNQESGQIALVFTPQESTGSDSPAWRGGVTRIPLEILFEDARVTEEPTVVGEGQFDSDSRYPLHSSNSVVEFAGDVFLRQAQDWGVRVVDVGERVLKVSLVRFFVTESDKALGSMYTGEVRVEAALESAEGATLWEGGGFGDARRYGKSDSNENRNEVLSDAMKEAYAYLFDDASLQGAWAGETPAGAGAAGQDTRTLGTAADLLREILVLQEQGIGTEFLIRFVQQHGRIAAFTAEDVLEWKQADIPDDLIGTAMTRVETN